MDDLIRQLGAEQTPCIRVFNKCDEFFGILPHGENIVCVSARTGEGMDALIQKISAVLDQSRHRVHLCIPYADAGILDLLNREAIIKNLEYGEGGIEIDAVVTAEVFGRIRRFIPGWEAPREAWEQ